MEDVAVWRGMVTVLKIVVVLLLVVVASTDAEVEVEAASGLAS